VKLRVLGDFSLEAEGRPVIVTSKKNRALLAVVALSPGRRATREKLCGLLWGDRGEEQARSSLRQSLAVLRRELGAIAERIFARHDDVLALHAGTLAVDVLDLARLLEAGGPTNLREAAEICRGELLADCPSRGRFRGLARRREAQDG
jgi:DNA-binding SARP family transcriptional activator